MCDLLNVMREEIVDSARRLGLGVVHGYDIARAVEERLRRELGPGHWYVPGEDKDRRDRRIRAAASNGADIRTLCNTFGLSPRSVRRILRGEVSS